MSEIDPVTARDEYYIRGGRSFASPLPEEEIVISGMAAVFPNCSDIYEFKEKLFNKGNMVAPNRKWDFHSEIPSCSGTISEINRFDCGFFGIHERQSHSLDAMARIFQEKAVEAIFDAGLHPTELQGTKTGVYVGVCSSENDKAWYFDNLNPQTFAVTGSERSMIAHRLSYFLKLKGPSTILDTACSSSSYALENAYRAIRLGEIDNAVVAGTNLCLYSNTTMQFLRLGLLSDDGFCKAFDSQGNGYARAEGVAVVILQKRKYAKRIYTQLVHVKTNCDGFKEQGITFPSGESQTELLIDMFEECGVDKFSLSFVEAHGTGTKAGDPEECTALDNVLTSGRRNPLPIGSVKSNIGHTEPASGLCSIIKCVLAMETGYIPPNIHFDAPGDAMTGLVEGRLKVVTEKTPLEDKDALMGVNNFGFGGANAHVLLKRNSKTKTKPKDNLPRLVCVSGRTVEAILVLLDHIETSKMDVEYIGLLHEVFAKNIQNHLYRGYTIVPQFGGVTKSLDYCPEYNKPLYLSFDELNNWHEVGRELMAVEAFRDIILRLQEPLTRRGISISNVLLDDGPLDKDSISVIGPVVVQIAIIHLLSLLDVKFDGSFGCSLGELVSAYCNEILTLDETIDCAFTVNKTHDILDTTEYENFMGLEDEYNLNGHPVDTCKGSLKILAKDHTKSKGANNHFMSILRKNRCVKVDSIKPNSIILQIGNSALNTEHSIVRLFGNESKDHLVEFLTSLGRLYVSGYNPQINRLYSRVDFPVSSGTAMISPYIRWKHNREIFVPNFSLDLIRQAKHGIKHYRIETIDSQWAFVVNNVVDGKRLFPASGYLYMVWETFSLMHGVPLNTSRVSLRNCRFLSNTRIPHKDSLFFRVSILIGTGEFEVIHGTSAVATGTVSFLPDKETEVLNLRLPGSLESRGLPLKKKDVYKELRLRGYNYSGEFRAIEETDLSASKAYIKWHKNWTAFMDNMLQLKTLQSDSRLLQLPIFISELNIAADVHFELVKETCRGSDATLSSLPVYNDRTTGKIRCGGITITGVITNSVPREKHLNKPVLESLQFVPNSTNLDLHNSVRVNVHIILENTLVQELKVVEFIDDFSDDDAEPLSPLIKSVLQDEPLVQPLITILSAKNLDVEVEVTNNKLEKESNCQLVIASKVVTRPEVLREAFAALKEDGFIMSRENHNCEVRSDLYPDITVVTVHRTTLETILLVRKRTPQQKANYIKVDSSGDFSWVPKVQIELNRSPEEQLVLYSEDSTSGIVGMVKCLRREPRMKNIRCVFVMNGDAKFNPNSTIYREQSRKNLAVNVYKNGEWGTLRHLPLEVKMVESEQCFVNITNRGVKWTEGPLRHDAVPDAGKELIYVYYSSLNFRDVTNTHVKINSGVRLEQECVFGVEFSGRDKSGTRVMGWSKTEAPSNLLLVERGLIYQIPDNWTLEEAATVPSDYITAIYALIMRGSMKSGESILIHNGIGCLGQAAIYLALHYGCKVFTTVGTQTQHDFIKKMYPQLKDENIGNSHDATFEQMVYEGTKGRGIDLVLNCLTEEKLEASVRCLANGGRFLQVGNPDSTDTNRLNLLLFEKQASFHGIALDETFSQSICCEIRKLLKALIREGAVKPLNRRTFKCDDVGQAFEFMAARSNIGKVLVVMREPEEQLVVAPSVQKLCGTARYYCDPKRVYMIVGGLGGFGLELADWLVLRGARKLVLTSRKGITSGYQQYRIKLWQSYGTVVKISTIPVTTRDGCKQSIEEALELGPIAAVFNLAVVLADAIFENQTTQSFAATFEPKALATKHLDDLTRAMCADLREFVVFSSVCCGRGNAGQSNYGMANSVMERICENRKHDGFPALAIEWGAIGETGIAAENEELVVTGTMQQPIVSCLDVLDVLLTQKDASVVSSLVVAEKHRLQSSDNVVEAVVNIIGSEVSTTLHFSNPTISAYNNMYISASDLKFRIDQFIRYVSNGTLMLALSAYRAGLKDAKCVSPYSTLAELGLDSMIAVEIKLMLERLFQIFVSTKDLRTMTLASLKEIQEGKHQLCLCQAK